MFLISNFPFLNSKNRNGFFCAIDKESWREIDDGSFLYKGPFWTPQNLNELPDLKEDDFLSICKNLNVLIPYLHL